MCADAHILAVTGLAREARIASGPGVIAVAGGGDAGALAILIEEAIANGVAAIISFGIAGALDPALEPGACIVATSIVGENACWPVDPAWSHAIERRLPQAIRADLAGVHHVVADAAAKRALFASRGAAAVDMESHIAAMLAQDHDLPFAAFRVVADPARRALPRAAAIALRKDGSVDILRVVKSLLRSPGELPLLGRAALDAQRAFRALRRGRGRLGDALCFGDVGQFARYVL